MGNKVICWRSYGQVRMNNVVIGQNNPLENPWPAHTTVSTAAPPIDIRFQFVLLMSSTKVQPETTPTPPKYTLNATYRARPACNRVVIE